MAIKHEFKRRIAALFPGCSISDDYRENPDGSINGREGSWVEFGVLDEERAVEFGTEITLAQLQALGDLLGTDVVEVVGQMDFDGRQYAWITCYGVEFGSNRKKKLQ